MAWLAPQGGEEEGKAAARELLGALVAARRGGARHGELEGLVAAHLGDAGDEGGASGTLLAALELLATAPVKRTEAIHLACLLLGGVPTAPGPVRPASHPFCEGRVGRQLLVEGGEGPSSSAAVRLRAGRLVGAALAQQAEALDPRIVLRIAQTFGLTQEDLPGDDLDLLRYIRSLLASRQTAVTVAPALAVQFRVGDFGEAGGVEDVEDLLDRIASEYGDEQSAFALANFLSDDLRKKLVRTHLEAKRYKAAFKAMRAFGLDATFPTCETDYRKSSLRRMAKKHQWGVAAGYIESLDSATDKGLLARYLLELALEQRLVPEAVQIKKRFGLAFDISAWMRVNGVDQAALRGTYLSLDEGRYQLRFVADAAAAEEMLATIRRASPAVVGVDSEWKPKFERKGQGAPAAPVALVQLAVPGSVFLVDALVPAALEALAAILSDARARKLGFGIKEDLRRLAQVVPALEAGMPNVVDLGDLWGAVKPEPRPKGGLAGMCRAVLGKPLDKSQQLTDWEQRPLTAAQIEYAALDAIVCIDLWQALVGSEGERSKAAREVAFDFAPSRRPRQLGPDDVQAFLRAQGLAEGLLVERVPRSPGGRGAVPEGAGQDIQVLKSIAVMPPCILLLNSNEKACFRAVEAALERGEVRLASPEECVRVFGYRVGSMPPFGHRKKMTALLDEKLLGAGALWSGGGSPNHLVGPFSGRQLASAAGARAVRLTGRGPPTISAGILPRSSTRLLRLAKR